MAKSRLTPDYIEWVLRLNADEAAREMHKLNEANKELSRQQNATRQAMVKLEAEGKKGSKEWQNLKKSVKEYGDQIKSNNEKLKELDKRLDVNQMSAAQLKKKLKDLNGEFRNTSKAIDPKRYRELSREIDETQRAYLRATGASKGFLGTLISFSKMKTVIKGFFMGIGSALAQSVIAGFGKAAHVIVEFEKANSKLAGVLGSTKAGIAGLTNEARRLGATTNYTASEVTDLQTELAKLGFDKDQIKAMEEPVLRFAVAVGTDLGSAATVAGGALRTFGKDASESEDVLATLAIATSKSALSFEHFATMLSTAAPVAHAFGFTLEDTTALMGALKNANFDASSAATATRNILLNLADSNGKLAKALGGPVKNLDDLVAGLKRLDAAGIDLATALDLTDKRSVAAFETFINGADSILQLRDSITGVNGAFNDMYKEMGDNAATSMKILSSTVEGLFLKFYEGKGAFKSFIEMLTQFVQGISDTVGRANSPINLLFTGLSNIFKVIGTVIKVLSACSRVVYAGVAAWIALKVAVILGHKALAAKAAALRVYAAACAAGRAAITALTGATNAATVATKELDAATTATPWGALVKAIILVATGIIAYTTAANNATDSTNKLKTAQDEITDAQNKANESIAEQVLRVNKLNGILHDNNIELSERQKALLALKKIVPNYHAKLTKEGKLIDDNTAALKAYIVKLKAAAMAQAYFDKMAAIQQEVLDARLEESRKRNNIAHVQYQLDSNPDFESRTGTMAVGGSITGYTQSVGDVELNEKRIQKTQELTKQQNALAAATKKRENAESRLAAVEKQMMSDPLVKAAYMGIVNSSGSGSGRGGGISNIDKTNDGLSTTVDRLKEINSELKQLRKADPQTDEEFEQIQAKIKALTEEKNKLMGKGGKTGKHGKNGKNGTPGTYKEDSLDEVTAPLDLEHQRNMLNLNKRKAELTEAELIIKKSEEIIRYENEVKNALQDLANKTDATHTKTLDKIKKQQEQSEANILAAQEAINNARVSQDEEYYGKRMEALKAFNNGIQDFMQQALNKGIIQEEQASIYRLNSTRLLHQEELKELQQHLAEIGQKDYYTAEQRKKIQEDLNKQIVAKNRELLADISSIQQKVAEMTADPIGLDGLERNLEREKAAVAAAYDAMISVARQNGLETIELERSKLQKLRDLEFEYQEELWGIKERLGVNWQEEYDHEVSLFRKMLDDELISQSQFEKKLFELRVLNAKKWFDYYHGLSGSMFSAIQQAEIDQSDAKYDVLIRQAENAGEDTAALEEEKENKKLEIQKKYADVDFAVKASQIVADTAVAIMKTWAQLGWPAGAIGAAFIAATGVAQLISAKAERDKVKRLQPKSSGAGQSMGTAERVLSGYSEGGYTGDGRRLEVAGVVHKGEYVVPQPIMGDPRVVDAVGMIEAIRRQRRGLPWQSHGPRDNVAGGFAEGGYTGGGSMGDLAGVAAELRAATEAVRNLRAYIVYQDIEKAGEVLTQARAPFTRKK